MDRNFSGLNQVDGLRVAVRRTLLASSFTAAALAWAVTPASAQEAAAGAGEQRAALEEVIVTAQRREESLQDVPVSVAAFSSEEISSRGAQSLSDLGMATPNVSFNSSVTGQNVRIRGVGAGDTSLIFEPGVGIYIDGLYLPRMNSMNLDLIGIERVEVLRGPQGTLFGRNTIGGAINVTTARPSDEFKGVMEVTAGSLSRLDFLAGIEGPIAEGALTGKLAGVIRQRDGYAKRLDFATGAKLEDAANMDRYAIRGSLNWTPSDAVDVLFSVDYVETDELGPLLKIEKTFQTGLVTLSNAYTTPDYNDQYLTPDGYSSYGTGPNADTSDQTAITLNVDWDLGGTTFKSITAYLDQFHELAQDLDGADLNLFEQVVSEDASYFSQEFQLSGLSMGERLNWITGLYYAQEEAHLHGESYIFQTLYQALRIDASQYLDIWTDNWNAALFGQGDYKLTDKLTMTLGGRYGYDNKKVANFRARMNPTPPGAVTLPYQEAEDNWSAWSGRLAFQYDWTDDVMTYLSAARGYKSGGINGITTTAGAFLPFDPEYLWTYELGVRSDLLDQRLRVNASVFYSDYQDIQFRVYRQLPDGGLQQIVDNVGEAEVKGLELELTAVPVAGLQLSAGLGYMDAQYTYVEAGAPAQLDDEIVDTPEWTFTGSAQYTRELQGGAQILGRLDYSWRDDQQKLLNNSPYAVQEAYGMLNARLAYTSANGNWEVAVFGNNLTDEEVMNWAFDISSAMNIFSEYAPPRTWGGSLKYSF